MAKRKFIRSYPDTWSILKIADFIGDCRRTGRIPPHVKAKSKKNKRTGMVTLTWTWKD